jgi:hypothetical protein
MLAEAGGRQVTKYCKPAHARAAAAAAAAAAVLHEFAGTAGCCCAVIICHLTGPQQPHLQSQLPEMLQLLQWCPAQHLPVSSGSVPAACCLQLQVELLPAAGLPLLLLLLPPCLGN